MQSGLAHFCVFQLCVADLAIFYFGRTIWYVNETYYAKSHDILMEDALESRIRTKSTEQPQEFFRKKTLHTRRAQDITSNAVERVERTRIAFSMALSKQRWWTVSV